MQAKNDKTAPADKSNNLTTQSAQGFAFPFNYLPSSQQVHQYAWQLSNFTTVAFATSASIVAVQSPIKTFLLNLSKNGTMIPPYQGGVLGFFRTLYAGTSASLSGSAVRTAYVTGAKNSKPIEEVKFKEEGMLKEENSNQQLSRAKLGYVMSMAFGDILVTQIPESLSQLKKVPGLLPVDFKWKNYHNVTRLMLGGFTPRYCSGLINFASLCLLEEEFAKRLPTQNREMAHFYAGALSGMTAAFFSYPFTSFKDYLLVRATVQNGYLYNANAFTVGKDLFNVFSQAPKNAVKSVCTNAAKQLPLRMGLTGVIFALVSGVGATLGSEPLKEVVPEKYQPLSITDAPQSFFSTATSSSEKVEFVPTNDSSNQPGK